MLPCLSILIAATLLAWQPEDKGTAEKATIYEGALDVGAIKLRLTFHLTALADGTWKGTMDSIDQGARNLPLSAVKVDGDQVLLEFKAGGAKYTGKRTEDGKEIEGTWEQAGQKFPLKLRRVEKATTLIRPQEPKPPFPYRAEDVKYPNPKAKGVTLAGTLTIPDGTGPFPCIILISGSGPQDRNEELVGHKPFLVLADHFTRQGIAVLRFDDRGVAKSTGNHETATSADFATDVEAGIDFLKTRAEIDPKRIGLMGHSEGGLIAPMVAVARPQDVALIVLLAGPGLPGAEILQLQSNLIAEKMGADRSSLEKNSKLIGRALELMKEEADDAKLKGLLKEEVKKLFAELSAEERAEALKKLRESSKDKSDEELFEVAAQQAEAGLLRMANPWMRFFVDYDPRPTLAQVKCPILAVNGDLDLQVPWEVNLTEIEKAAKAGNNADVTCVRAKGLNHLFQNTKTGLPSEYGQIEETFCPRTMTRITEWLQERFEKK